MNVAEAIQEVRQYLTFRLAEETYGIEVLNVREILDFPAITKVPQVPAYMLGVINLRGSVTPVVDLRKRFNVVVKDLTKDTCIIVIEITLKGEPLVIGIVGDTVEEVVDLVQDQIEPPPKLGIQLNTDFILGMGKQDEDFVLLLDIDKIFSADELSDVSSLVEG